MKLDKAQILDLLRRSRTDGASVRQAEQELPDQVDTVRDADLLSNLGLNTADVVAELTGHSSGIAGMGGLGREVGRQGGNV